MIQWREGFVTRRVREWRGAVQLEVSIQDIDAVPAIAYPDLVGEPVVGDRVLLNTNALELGLGTGGMAFVVAIPDRLPPDHGRPNGHIVKARYSPLQTIRLAVDEEASPARPIMERATHLAGMPVVTADLHSALPAILAAIHADAPGAKVAYVMTDGGALPAGLSRTLDALADELVGVVTAGQAWGGDLEAVNVHSGLLAARHVLGADLTVVSQGPGNLGTGTTWGFSGVSVGESVNAAATLGGRPVGSLRLSDADPRPRHRGVSHHSLTAYGQVALLPADIAVPAGLRKSTLDALRPLADRHRLVTVRTDGLEDALRKSPAQLSTMGRDLDDDPVYFLAAAVAGRHAASLLTA
ncbi:DUF3866 family protein [Allorhizocola rhizosphaerae]|uniref:DUF3866 family protein n=1 Tax=Allorhizocola rhizosphaerae TaxID=1872709 RepID=UPI000E3BE587|nr:DUF3866 family protein [Allorhizocola rhizosphaerae]